MLKMKKCICSSRHHRSRLQQQPPAAAASSTAAAAASAEEVCLPMAPPPPVTRRRRRRSITKESASPARSPMVQAKNLAAHDADGEDNDGNNEAKSLIGLISHYKLIWVAGCVIR